MACTETKRIEVTRDDGGPYSVPCWQVTSGLAGPFVLVTAALHANELQGAEILRRFLPTAGADMTRGSCVLIPFANPIAVQRHQPHIDFELGRYYGSDQVNNVNCTWPGDPNGSNAQRLSNALFNSVVGEATHLIDLHCWQKRRAATALAREGREDSLRLAEATALRFGRHSKPGGDASERPKTPCTLSTYFHDTDRTAIAVEFAGQYAFWPRQIELGLRLLRNAFRQFEMLPGELEGQDGPFVWVNDAEMVEIPAPTSGVFVPAELGLSDHVETGQEIGHMLTVDSLCTVEVLSPVAGCPYELGPVREQGSEHTEKFMHPYADEGELVAVVAATGR